MADKKKTGKELVRITSMCVVDGKTYQPNQVVGNIPAKELQVLIDSTQATADPAAIKYCLEELEVESVDHTAKPTEKNDKEAE